MRRLLQVTASIAVLALFAGVAAAEPDGKALYNAKCAMCHGTDGVAKAMWAKTGIHNLNDPAWQKSKSDAEIKTVIVDGTTDKKMPAYKDKMSAEEIAAVVKHIRSLAPGK
jgi:mono/diheme cytochrome c family protein